MEFFNRVNELDFLKKKLASGKAELIVLEGRRRLGKTELVKQLRQKRPEDFLYFFVLLSEPRLVLDDFSRSVLEQTKHVVRFESPASFFGFIADWAKEGTHKRVVVLDEFQRLGDVDYGFVTALQRAWDEKFSGNPRFKLILCGSSVSAMAALTGKAGAPLYGRKTAHAHLEPFNYASFRFVFKEWPEEEKIRAFTIFGGTPAFFMPLKIGGMLPGLKAIRELVLEKEAPLREEPRELFAKEARKSARYNAILQAIAAGHHSVTEIANYVSSRIAGKVRPGSLPAYFSVLSEQLNILDHDDPVFGKEKHGRYQFSDPFFGFWYRFVFPNQEPLELGNIPYVEELINAQLPVLEGKTFEKICREFLKLHNTHSIKGLPLNLTKLGAWWSRKPLSGHQATAEIDIVAQNGDALLVGEVKYRNESMRVEDLAALVDKSQQLPRKGKIDYIAFSKSGFLPSCMDYAKSIGCTTFDLKEMSALWDAGHSAHEKQE